MLDSIINQFIVTSVKWKIMAFYAFDINSKWLVLMENKEENTYLYFRICFLNFNIQVKSNMPQALVFYCKLTVYCV